MCLISAVGTTLILEQPELHLNPKVQTRLADFFLSMSLLGKQCLLETHSEYLINRLRFRAASASEKSLSSLMKLYFVEKQHEDTVYRDVVINEYGTIVNWPEGFFDQSQREIEDILLAATKKAKTELSK
jgi:predicted ATPase